MYPPVLGRPLMIELGALAVAVALGCDLWYDWRTRGLGDRAVHVYLWMLLGSALLTLGGWEHRREWMGLTLACAAAPGLVVLWALWRKAHEALAATLKQRRMRLGR